jgi:uncharacterized membrane protein YphA (DoxX/SURF4 family)
VPLLLAMTLVHGAAVIARVTLAVVFAVASFGKLRDLQGTRDGVSTLASPAIAVLAPGLPAAELAVSIGLLVPRFSRGAAIAAIVLLVVFSALIIRALKRGHAPVCHCFGARTVQPININMVARNGAFIALALVAVAA